MVFYKEDFYKLSFLQMVKLGWKAQGKVNDYSFFLISQGVEDIKYTG